MIINIKNQKNLITLDFILKQIRFLKNFEDKDKTEITFIDISSDNSEGYENLFNLDKRLFLKTLKWDLLGFYDIKVKLKELEVLNGNSN